MTHVGTLTAVEYRGLPLDTRIRLAASQLLGMRYGRTVTFPRSRPGLPDELVDPHGDSIDCSSLTAYILFTCYPFIRWTSKHYAELQIMDPSKPWSPIQAVMGAGVGSPVDRPVGGCWHLTQRWKSLDPLSGGHARLCYADVLRPDRLHVLEASSRRGGIGPCWSEVSWDSLVSGDAQAQAAALGEG